LDKQAKMAIIKMEQQDTGLLGMGATLLGYAGTMLGAFWNIQSMQIIAFLFTAFAGFCTGIYYIVKAIKEIINKNKLS
jgi:hypothetical protein